MKKIALIPNENVRDKNQCFQYMPWLKLKELLKDELELNTVDIYKDYGQVDWFVFNSISYDWLGKLSLWGLEKRFIYFAWEPEVVDIRNSADNLEKLLEIFAYIFTWNDALVDNKRVFKFICPLSCDHHWNMETINPFRNRKLLVNISGNKHSNHGKELYSERKKIIDFFEDGSDEFDLYGVGWDATEKNYKGLVKDKGDTYPLYKFALCLENAKDLNGYITEKIIDCFVGQTVPVYGGAKNVTKWIPQECYVDYFQFDSIDKLIRYLKSMDDATWLSYMKAIDGFLNSSKIEVFSVEDYANRFRSVGELDEPSDFKISLKRRFMCSSYFLMRYFAKKLHIKKFLPKTIYARITKQIIKAQDGLQK